jgi:hypothetical protein
MKRRLGIGLAVFWCCAVALACKVTDPSVLLPGCVSAGTRRMQPDEVKELICDLNEDSLVIALPRGAPKAADELIRKSVPRNIAEILSENEVTSSHWCFVASHEGAPASTRATIVCAHSDTPIEGVFVARGRHFRLTLTRAGAEPAWVTNVRASE